MELVHHELLADRLVDVSSGGRFFQLFELS
jgi:hypothetical protein